MGCNCGKSFSNPYATGMRRSTTTSHVPNTRPVTPTVRIQSKSLASRAVNGAQMSIQPTNATSARRKV